MLHILMNSPFLMNFNLMFNMLNKDDNLIALQDGVVIAIKNGIFLNYFINTTINLYVLKEDVISRGISLYISKKFNIINYSEFLILTEKNKRYMNW